MGKTGGSTMTLNLTISEKEDLKPRITVFGVGGAPPTPNTVMRGFKSSFSEIVKFNVIVDPPVLPIFWC